MLTPQTLRINSVKDTLILEYPNGSEHQFSAEYLRVFSPSAEVRGHGKGQEILQHGKRHVLISSVEKAGNYAIQITFSDSHNTGIYSWDYLYKLADDYTNNWIDYLSRLHQAGKSRDTDTQVVKIIG
ncbi:MAG TPA: 1-(5-phosphoribosyl)-5-((5-phosphoribosylamino)methylideneamino)imidazole-4-carboxamide isomerase [Porticoccaceae bacterium]|jgi:DUF971 family protein|nr:1-(5-phosphoribosyl)-5-((5-phosphoribosylamino)methylideneamino)imidazole-4-carboxamide isomerase [Porticoccaceae bacterium]